MDPSARSAVTVPALDVCECVLPSKLPYSLPMPLLAPPAAPPPLAAASASPAMPAPRLPKRMRPVRPPGPRPIKGWLESRGTIALLGRRSTGASAIAIAVGPPTLREPTGLLRELGPENENVPLPSRSRPPPLGLLMLRTGRDAPPAPAAMDWLRERRAAASLGGPRGSSGLPDALGGTLGRVLLPTSGEPPAPIILARAPGPARPGTERAAAPMLSRCGGLVLPVVLTLAAPPAAASPPVTDKPKPLPPPLPVDRVEARDKRALPGIPDEAPDTMPGIPGTPTTAPGLPGMPAPRTAPAIICICIERPVLRRPAALVDAPLGAGPRMGVPAPLPPPPAPPLLTAPNCGDGRCASGEREAPTPTPAAAGPGEAGQATPPAAPATPAPAVAAAAAVASGEMPGLLLLVAVPAADAGADAAADADAAKPVVCMCMLDSRLPSLPARRSSGIVPAAALPPAAAGERPFIAPLGLPATPAAMPITPMVMPGPPAPAVAAAPAVAPAAEADASSDTLCAAAARLPMVSERRTGSRLLLGCGT